MNPSKDRELLAVLQSRREEDVQQYLTRNPHLLLTALCSPWTPSECIPKFRFGTEFVSDFVILSPQSLYCAIILVELEPPTEPPFTKDGKYARRLNAAMGQINDWFSWIHENPEYFLSSLAKQTKRRFGAGRGASLAPDRRWHDFVTAKIVIGRREMLSPDDDKRRATLLAQTGRKIEIVPYDRLLEPPTGSALAETLAPV